MELLKPMFKLPEVAFGAGVSSSNLSNWYDRGHVDSFCREKDGWKRYCALDVYHVALIKQMVVLGVPIPHANEIAKGYLDLRLTPCRLVPVSPLLFVVLQLGEMLFVEPDGEQYRVVSFDKNDGIHDGTRGVKSDKLEFPESERGHIILPIGPILEKAFSKALTGRDDVELEYDQDEGRRYVQNVKDAIELRNRQAGEKSPDAKPQRSELVQNIVSKIDKLTATAARTAEMIAVEGNGEQKQIFRDELRFIMDELQKLQMELSDDEK